MTTHWPDRALRLTTGELLDIKDGLGLTVACLEGAVWITQQDDPRDIDLTAGQSCVLDRPGLALVCAAGGPSAITVRARAPAAPRVPWLPPYRWTMRNAARPLPAATGGL